LIYKWISRLGIGTATVDTHIEQEQYTPGESLAGEVIIRGGLSTQSFDQIELHVMLEYRSEGKKTNQQYKLKNYKLNGPVEVPAGEMLKIPFQVSLPDNMPMSSGHFPIYIKTVCDAKFAIDPIDQDKITIIPVKLIQNLLKVIEDAGFILYKIENLALPQKNQNTYPFMQIFVFRPTGGNHGLIDEFSVVFTHTNTSFKMEMEILRASQALESTFEWNHHDPEGTFRINGTPTEGNPFEKLRSLLKKNRGVSNMNIFKNPLTSFGIGAAKVDARLEKSTFRQGEQVVGQVYVQGGGAEQRIDEVYIYLVMQYEYEGSQAEYLIEKFLITEAFSIKPKEERRLPFQFQLPYDVPVSTSGAPIYLKTGLDIKMARDPQDVDGVEILPHAYIDMILEAVEDIDFQLSNVKFDFEHHFSRHPFVQTYHYTPTGKMEDLLDSISFVFYADEREVEVVIQLDKKGDDLISSMEEAFQLDERLGRFTISQQEIHQGREILVNRLVKEMNKLMD
jgi:sporulation-control protein